jgi:hypothetical protein
MPEQKSTAIAFLEIQTSWHLLSKDNHAPKQSKTGDTYKVKE